MSLVWEQFTHSHMFDFPLQSLKIRRDAHSSVNLASGGWDLGGMMSSVVTYTCLTISVNSTMSEIVAFISLYIHVWVPDSLCGWSMGIACQFFILADSAPWNVLSSVTASSPGSSLLFAAAYHQSGLKTT